MTTFDPSAVAAEVRAEMGRQRLTVAALSGQVGMSAQTLHRRLDRPEALTLAELLDITDVLGVPLDALLDRARAAA